MDFEDQQNHQALDKLWQSYRDATPEVDASVNFMPGLWNKIEAKRARRQIWQIAAQRLLAAALTCCLIAVGVSFGEAIWNPGVESSQYVYELESEDETLAMAVLFQEDQTTQPQPAVSGGRQKTSLRGTR